VRHKGNFSDICHVNFMDIIKLSPKISRSTKRESYIADGGEGLTPTLILDKRNTQCCGLDRWHSKAKTKMV